MFERFSDRARQAVSLAGAEARRFESNRIEELHLLVGLIKEGGGLAARTLLRSSNAQFILEECDKRHRPKASTSDQSVSYSPGAKETLEGTIPVAQLLKHDVIGTGHLLMSLLKDSESSAALLIAELNLSPTNVRMETARALELEPPEPRSMPVNINPSELWGEAYRFGSSSVSGEHLLLFLVRTDSIRDLLALMHVRTDEITAKLESQMQISNVATGQLRPLLFEPSTNDVVQNAEVLAKLLEEDAIKGSHLLLALLLGEASPAKQVLESSGVTLARLRAELFRKNLAYEAT